MQLMTVSSASRDTGHCYLQSWGYWMLKGISLCCANQPIAEQKTCHSHRTPTGSLTPFEILDQEHGTKSHHSTNREKTTNGLEGLASSRNSGAVLTLGIRSRGRSGTNTGVVGVRAQSDIIGVSRGNASCILAVVRRSAGSSDEFDTRTLNVVKYIVSHHDS